LKKLRSSNVLEIGCGKGIVVSYLRSKNINCLGVELAKIQLPENVSHFIYSEMSSLSIPDSIKKSFDTLLFLDVLEHIENPQLFLREQINAFPFVKNIIITLPARNELWSNYDEFYGHYKRYDIASFQRHLLLNGWNVERVSYFFKWLYPLVYLLSIFRVKRSVKVKAPSRMTKPFHFIMAFASILEFKVLPNCFWGTSIICVIKKNEV
jgi:hypothetical protein